MKHTQSAGGVVLNKRGEVLVVNQNGDSWSLPKGHLEAGETAQQAAEREIAEESGIQELVFLRDLGSYDRPRLSRSGGDDPTEIKSIHLFLFSTSQEALKPSDPAHPEARWVKKTDVAALLTHPKDKEFFVSVLSKIGPA